MINIRPFLKLIEIIIATFLILIEYTCDYRFLAQSIRGPEEEREVQQRARRGGSDIL